MTTVAARPIPRQPLRGDLRECFICHHQWILGYGHIRMLVRKLWICRRCDERIAESTR